MSGGAAAGAVRQRLAEAGIGLPPAYGTVYGYVPLTVHHDMAILSGQIPKTAHDAIACTGRLGTAVDVEAGQTAARLAALQALAWLDTLQGGLDRVAAILKLDVHCAVDDDFAAISTVADAASGILVVAFGEPGRHARSVLGVRRLPRNAPVLVNVTAALHPAPPEPR